MRRMLLLMRMLQRQEQSRLVYFVSNALVLPLAMASTAQRLFAGDPQQSANWIIGSAFFGAGLGSVTQVGFSTMFDRLRGRVRLLQISGVRRLDYVAAYVFVATLWTILLVIGATAIFVGLKMLRPTVELFAAAAAAAIAVGLFYGTLGAAIGTNAKTSESGTGALIAVGTLGGFMSPVLYPPGVLPHLLAAVAGYVPLALGADLTKTAAKYGTIGAPSVVVLLLVCSLGAAALYQCVRWRE